MIYLIYHVYLYDLSDTRNTFNLSPVLLFFVFAPGRVKCRGPPVL